MPTPWRVPSFLQEFVSTGLLVTLALMVIEQVRRQCKALCRTMRVVVNALALLQH